MTAAQMQSPILLHSPSYKHIFSIHYYIQPEQQQIQRYLASVTKVATPLKSHASPCLSAHPFLAAYFLRHPGLLLPLDLPEIEACWW
jgi:hypothetical protein